MGETPKLLVGYPSHWTAEQIADFQRWWNEVAHLTPVEPRAFEYPFGQVPWDGRGPRVDCHPDGPCPVEYNEPDGLKTWRQRLDEVPESLRTAYHGHRAPERCTRLTDRDVTRMTTEVSVTAPDRRECPCGIALADCEYHRG